MDGGGNDQALDAAAGGKGNMSSNGNGPVRNLLVTGYRAHELNIFDRKHKGIGYIRKAIAAKLEPLAEEGLEWVITPGQYGTDLWACEAVIELKERYPDLKLSILAAYANPEEKWKDDRKDYYNSILKAVDYYGFVSNQPYNGVWQLAARDELLLRKTDGILLFYDEEAAPGSPRYLKDKAMRKRQEEGYRVMTISPEDVQAIADEERMGEAE